MRIIYIIDAPLDAFNDTCIIIACIFFSCMYKYFAGIYIYMYLYIYDYIYTNTYIHYIYIYFASPSTLKHLIVFPCVGK